MHKVCERDVFQPVFLHQIYNLGAVWDKNESSRFWGQKVKGQLHDRSKYGPFIAHFQYLLLLSHSYR